MNERRPDLRVVAGTGAPARTPSSGTSRSSASPLPGMRKRDPAVSDPPSRQFAARLIEILQPMAEGWNDGVRRAFNFPNLLFVRSEEGPVIASGGSKGGIATIVQNLQFGQPIGPASLTEFGLAIYDRTSTTYLVLVDPSRRIVVRYAFASLHSAHRTQWADIQTAIEGAAREAASTGQWVFSDDGFTRLL